jgi:type IV fimbrial biogenesis protein FimT
MLMNARRPAQVRGFTLIELMIGLAIMALLLSLAAPSFSTMIANSKVRGQAESIFNGLQLARAEALKRNTTVQFRLTSNLTSGCTGETDGTAWVVSLFDAAGKCDKATDLTTSPTSAGFNSATNPLILQKKDVGDPNLLVAAGQAGICFNGLGQLTAVAGICTTNTTTISVSNPNAGTCKAGGGDIRCMDIRVSTGGMVRFCDPAVTATDDPRHC